MVLSAMALGCALHARLLDATNDVVSTMTDACQRCAHYDCIMDRGDVLPEHVTAYWADRTPYVPRPEATALHDQITRARDEMANLSSLVSVTALAQLVDRACPQSTTVHETSSPCSSQSPVVAPAVSRLLR